MHRPAAAAVISGAEGQFWLAEGRRSFWRGWTFLAAEGRRYIWRGSALYLATVRDAGPEGRRYIWRGRPILAAEGRRSFWRGWAFLAAEGRRYIWRGARIRSRGSALYLARRPESGPEGGVPRVGVISPSGALTVRASIAISCSDYTRNTAAAQRRAATRRDQTRRPI